MFSQKALETLFLLSSAKPPLFQNRKQVKQIKYLLQFYRTLGGKIIIYFLVDSTNCYVISCLFDVHLQVLSSS